MVMILPLVVLGGGMGGFGGSWAGGRKISRKTRKSKQAECMEAL